MRRATIAVLLAGLVGIPVGVGAFTFVYAKGFSYLSPDPRACENSMGFHAPQGLARILGETVDFARQGQLAADRAARKR